MSGRRPGDEVEFLREVGNLAQDIPLYRRWDTEVHLQMGAHLNRVWDDASIRDRPRSLGPLRDPNWQIDELSLEDIVLAHLGANRVDPAPQQPASCAMTWLL